MIPNSPVEACACCGHKLLTFTKVLWDELVQEWRLSQYERQYIDRQQGLSCRACGCNLRTMALALAICRSYGYAGTLARFVEEKKHRRLRVLELNEAGSLTQFLSKLPKHRMVKYPEVDMMRMPFADTSFDLVVHSDTLEHVELPVTGLSECRRVLSHGGYCAFTVPLIVDRMTVSRDGLGPSYHGAAGQRAADCVVHTEYGCDAWKHIVLAGFEQCMLITLEFPSAFAFVGVR